MHSVYKILHVALYLNIENKTTIIIDNNIILTNNQCLTLELLL